jgi:hypothetical protein
MMGRARSWCGCGKRPVCWIGIEERWSEETGTDGTKNSSWGF